MPAEHCDPQQHCAVVPAVRWAPEQAGKARGISPGATATMYQKGCVARILAGRKSDPEDDNEWM